MENITASKSSLSYGEMGTAEVELQPLKEYAQTSGSFVRVKRKNIPAILIDVLLNLFLGKLYSSLVLFILRVRESCLFF